MTGANSRLPLAQILQCNSRRFITLQRVFVISLEKPDVPENKMHQICVTCEEGEFDIPLLHNVNILICNTLIL